MICGNCNKNFQENVEFCSHCVAVNYFYIAEQKSKSALQFSEKLKKARFAKKIEKRQQQKVVLFWLK